VIAKATVFLDETRTKAVAAGDPKARFKLVHAGQEIPQAQAEKYEGAIELIGGTKKAERPSAPPELARESIETREPKHEHRDPKHKR